MIQLYIGLTYKIGNILVWEKDTKSSTVLIDITNYSRDYIM
jgi:hypothetical protein